jgi:nucleotide-binding universal stress UspA family protein
MEFKHILVPVDGSLESKEALCRAIDLAKQLHAELTVAYVVDLKEKLSSYEKLTNEEESYTEEEVKAEARKVLAPFKEIARGFSPVKFVVTVGAPGLTIVRLAKNSCADLIIIGNRGMGMVKRFFMGSVSNYVMENAFCPVMVVKLPLDMKQALYADRMKKISDSIPKHK